MSGWREWPKVCKGRSGAANTKHYRWVMHHGRSGLAAILGEPDPGLVCLGRYDAAGTVREHCEGFTARRALGQPEVAVVAIEPCASGVREVYQRYVHGHITGTPRFYGERWS